MNLLLHISVYICNMAMTRQRGSDSSTNFVSGSGVSDQGRLGPNDTDMCNIVIDGVLRVVIDFTLEMLGRIKTKLITMFDKRYTIDVGVGRLRPGP